MCLTKGYARQGRAGEAELSALVSTAEQVLGGVVSHAGECMTASTRSKNQLPPATRRYTTVGARGDPSDAGPEEQGQQAMRAILLIPLGFILIVLYLVTRRDEEEQPGGHGRTILEALIDLLSWRW